MVYYLETELGAVLAIADKLDTLLSFFTVGLTQVAQTILMLYVVRQQVFYASLKVKNGISH